MINGRFLDTLYITGDEYRYYTSSGSDIHHDHHHYHPYKRNDKGYFSDEFKKANPPTFAGDLDKLKYAKAWLLGLKKLFEMHDYIENMKAKIAIFSFKRKTNIWWEDVK